ncbi:MAG: ATP-binding protein [Tissierellia bacterium]|nr:ATP-binding protein [Tissierellia bacterium]
MAREILGLEPMDLDLDKYWDLGQLNIRDLNYFDAQSLSGTSQLEIKGRFYNVRYAPYKSEMGRNAGLIVVFQDITREHNLDLMRKEFVANVSHELKTPITTIKSYTETLMRVDLDGGGRQRFLTIINRETDRMSHLVTDLLQLSNLDAQRTHWDLVALDPYEMVTQAAESIKPLVDEKKHRLHLDIPMDLGPFYGDRHGTSQILVNILSNAAKYTTYGGDIRVRGRLSSEEDFIDIEVRDTGIGIPQKDLRRIFERFYRVEKGRSRAAGGTGLGLAIAKEIMESMGGRISIQSKFGVGTAVLLQFPTSKGGDL